jgi:hypothetical protein
MTTLKKEEIILTDIRNLFINTRSYPKCFQTNNDSIEIYDLISDKYPSLISKLEIKYLFSLYTLLLCGLGALSSQVSADKIKLRFSRFLNIKGDNSWNFIIKMLKFMINKDIEFYQSNMSPLDFETFKKKHSHLEKTLFQELKKYYE